MQLFLLLLAAGALLAEDGASIMARVAARVERASAERRQYVYRQDTRTRMLRTNGKVARDERRQYTVTPGEKTSVKELVKCEGEDHRGNKVIRYDKSGYESKGIDVDGSLLKSLTDDLVNDKDSRDGIPKSLFPLAAEDQRKYTFNLLETKDYKGRPTHRIAFEPAVKKNCADDNDSCALWNGEALIDAEDEQPVNIATDLNFKMPLAVKLLLGTNLRQTGFNVAYQRVAPGVWFPTSYGTEFRLDVLFGYHRVITLSVESKEFRRTGAESKIEFTHPLP